MSPAPPSALPHSSRSRSRSASGWREPGCASRRKRSAEPRRPPVVAAAMGDVATEGLTQALNAERRIEPRSNSRAAWEELFKDARKCTRCELYKYGTQTVFGEGPL